MASLVFFVVALLPLLSAARINTDQVYERSRAQYLASPPLRLDDASYEALSAAPRNHTLAVLLTALEPRFGCQLCKDFQPEWDILAKSAVRADRHGDGSVLYGTLDFFDGKATFQKLMLQTAPVILLFPPTHGPNGKADTKQLRYDFTAGPQSAEQIQLWVKRHLPQSPTFTIRRPTNYVRLIAVTVLLLGAISLLSVTYNYILPVVRSRSLWAAVSLITVLLFTSGHMFNHIRKVPYVAGDGKGGISYFAGGFSNQFGMESQIIAALYGVLAFATIALALKVPRMTHPKSQQVALFLWGTVLFGLYGTLLSVFRVKNGGYPFYLPPF